MDVEQEVLIGTEEVLVRVRVPVTRPTIFNWVRNGKFPKPRYIGTRNYWVESEVEEWMRSQTWK
jgi:predicted DNA-binding transcriptional regulator AlpA